MFRIVGKTYSVPVELLEKVAKATFSFLDLPNIEIELKFVSVREISRLNRVYRGKAGPTDVLSFTIDKKPLFGQVFICYTFTKAQAKSLGKTLPDEVALLLTHGILHVAGFDHTSTDEMSIMQKAELDILRKIGINR